jgi:hypothetical protein
VIDLIADLVSAMTASGVAWIAVLALLLYLGVLVAFVVRPRR